MKRLLAFAAGWLAVAPASADDGVYRCLAETIRYWTGDRAGAVETLPPGEYEIALRIESGAADGAQWAEMVTTGERYELDRQQGDPSELVARREDNRFSMRIDLDATPMRFAGIGDTSFLTGTCFFEPRTTK
jgi:hypothetical protein